MHGPQARRNLAVLLPSRLLPLRWWRAGPRLHAQALGVLVATLFIPWRTHADPSLAFDSGPYSPCTGLVRPAPALAPRAILSGEVQRRMSPARLHLGRGGRGARLLLPRPLLGLCTNRRSPPSFRPLTHPCDHSGPEIFHAFSGSGCPPSGYGAGVVISIVCVSIGIGPPRPAAARRHSRPIPQKLFRLARSAEDQTSTFLRNSHGVCPSPSSHVMFPDSLNDLRMCSVPSALDLTVIPINPNFDTPSGGFSPHDFPDDGASPNLGLLAAGPLAFTSPRLVPTSVGPICCVRLDSTSLPFLWLIEASTMTEHISLASLHIFAVVLGRFLEGWSTVHLIVLGPFTGFVTPFAASLGAPRPSMFTLPLAASLAVSLVLYPYSDRVSPQATPTVTGDNRVCCPF